MGVLDTFFQCLVSLACPEGDDAYLIQGVGFRVEAPRSAQTLQGYLAHKKTPPPPRSTIGA